MDASTTDRVEYLEFDGDVRSFFLMDDTKVWTNSRGRKKRDELLAARQQIQSVDMMTEELGNNIAGQIQAQVEAQLRVLVP